MCIWAGEITARDCRKLVRVNSKTYQVTMYTPPNTDGQLNGASRRAKVNSQGYIWCADYFGGNLTRFDPKTWRERKLFGLKWKLSSSDQNLGTADLVHAALPSVFKIVFPEVETEIPNTPSIKEGAGLRFGTR